MTERKPLGRRMAIVSVALVAALAVQGCGQLRKLAGVDKNPPDEFKIVNKPPLVMPPEFNLRPPKAGTASPQDLVPTAQAISALFPGRTTLPPPASQSEQALLQAAGSAGASSNVRSTAGDSGTLVVEKGDLIKDILTTGERENSPDGSSVDRVSSEPLKKDN